MPNSETNDLSDRELEILKLVATGASNKEIARKLFISSNTVKVHLRNIFTKISATSRTEAAMYAVHSGLVESAALPTTLNNGLTADDTSEINIDGARTLPKGNFLSTFFSNKFYVRFFGIFGIILLTAVIAMIYFQKNIFPSNTPTASSPTPRVQWFEYPGLPVPRRGLAVANYENQIYAIGGENATGISNIVESYDPKTNTWIDLSVKPTPVTDINAAVLGGLIYVPGGRLASGVPTNTTEIYDPRTDEWTTGAPLPKPLSAYALTAFEGRIFIFGGWDGKQILSDVYVYDIHSNTWSSLPSMPTPRSYAGAVSVGEKIYVIGGWNGSQALSTDEVFLPASVGESLKWIQATPLPSGRYGIGNHEPG